MKIGCCVDHLQEIAIAAELGYNFVDLPGEMVLQASGEAQSHLKQAGIQAWGIHAALPPQLAITGPYVDREQVKQYLSTLMEGAQLLEVSFVGIGSARSRSLPEGFPQEKADQQMVDFLTMACSMAPSNISLLVEALHPGETNYLNSIAHGLRLIREVDSPQCGLVLDLYHYIKAADSTPLSTELFPHIRYIHIADPILRAFPSQTTEDAVFQPLRRMASLGYQGGIAIEAVTDHFTEEARTGLDVLRRETALLFTETSPRQQYDTN